MVSSQAERLKPNAIDVKSPMDPIHLFLDGKEDEHSSYYLEMLQPNFMWKGLSWIGHASPGMLTLDTPKTVRNFGHLLVTIGTTFGSSIVKRISKMLIVYF